MISIRLLGAELPSASVASSRASGSLPDAALGGSLGDGFEVAAMRRWQTPRLPCRYARTDEKRGRRAPPMIATLFSGYTPARIAVRIERGGGTGPMKPRQPPARERCQFHQAPTTSLGDVERAVSSTSDHRPRRRFFNICRQSLFAVRNANQRIR